MIFKFPTKFLYLLCSGILLLEAKTDDQKQQQLVPIHPSTPSTNCDSTPILISSFTQETSFILLEVVTYGGGNVTVCTSPSTICYIGSSTGMVLYPSASKGETHLTAYLSVVLPHSTETIGLSAYKYGPHDPLPGGGGPDDVTDAILHYSRLDGMDKLSLYRATGAADCKQGEGCVIGNTSSVLFYDVFVKNADEFHSNYTYTQACERSTVTSPDGDDVSIACVNREELNPKNSLKRFEWTDDDDDVMSSFSMYGHECRNVVVVVQVMDPLFNSTSAYLPYHLNTSTGSQMENSMLTVINCCVLLVGSLICFFGHRLIHFSFLVHCCFVFTFVFSTALSPLMVGELVRYERLIEISTGAGALLDMILFIFWWKYNLMKMAVLIFSVSGGFVTSCILLATKVSSLPIMQQQLYVILFFSSVSLLSVSLNLLLTSHRSVMMTSSLLGSSLMIYSSNWWICSSVGLLLPHGLRRLVTAKFGRIVDVSSYMGQTDGMLIGIWCSLFLLGVLSQFYQHKSKANLPLTIEQHVSPLQVDDASSDDCSTGTYSYDGDVSDDTDHSENDDVTIPFRIVDERTALLPPQPSIT